MYRHKDGMIYDVEDEQTIATMSESATPEQGALLAAAPELLDALVGMIEAATHHQADLRQALRRARDAVSAAKGQS